MSWCIAIVAVIGIAMTALSMAGCDTSTGSTKQTPVAADYDIGNLNQTAGSVTPVTITPKSGKSPGSVTIKYDGAAALPQTAGTYAVTFDVAAATGWNEANGLSAGDLTVSPAVANQTPVAADYDIGNLSQREGSIVAVTITAKSGKSTGEVSNIRYNNSATIPQTKGTYPVTFDVAAAAGWNAASGLSAGNLVILGADENLAPTAGDYDIGNLSQTAGSVTAVTITPKSGKSSGAVSNIRYNNSATIPQTAGTYAVTFDVAAVTGWDAASGLSAGNLVVNPVGGGNDPTVSTVTVSPSTASVSKGGNQTFSATVAGTNDPAQTVTWSIVETGKHAQTTISAAGALSVAAAETLTSLTVRATSTVDTTKSGTASVTVGYTVTFDSNGGSAVANQTVADGTAARPDEPTRARATFAGWYTEDGDEWNFDEDTLTTNITLYARWSFTLPLTDLSDIEFYLAALSAGDSADEPASLPVNIDLGTMTQTDSGWKRLLTAIETAGKYVELDLSACTMNGISFNPDSAVATGKDKIVAIALPDTATSIVGGSYSDPTFKDFTSLRSFSGAGLTSIGSYAFQYCTNLALTELPAGLTSIGISAFDGCTNLALTELPAGITEIGIYAFRNCTNLALTELPAGITEIGSSAFENCRNLALTELPAGLTEIGIFAFENCRNLALTELPAGITSIGNGTFIYCTNLALTELPAGITEIGSSAFENCTNLALTELPAGLTEIGNWAFQNCTNLALTELPAGLTEIGRSAFSDCTNLALTELPAGLTEIGNNAFFGCTSLALTELPAGLTSIGNNAFFGCTNLATVICHAEEPPTLGTNVFYNTHTSLVIKVPEGSVDAYKANWSGYATRIVAIEE